MSNLPVTLDRRNEPRSLSNHGVEIFGVGIGSHTRCAHYNSDLDIIAIKFKCCGYWYPCFECHTAMAEHEPTVWPVNEFEEKAVLCGACGNQLTVKEYLDCDSVCPACGGSFNPGCANHYHLYFETAF